MPVRFRKEIFCHVKRVIREDPKFAKTKLYYHLILLLYHVADNEAKAIPKLFNMTHLTLRQT